MSVTSSDLCFDLITSNAEKIGYCFKLPPIFSHCLIIIQRPLLLCQIEFTSRADLFTSSRVCVDEVGVLDIYRDFFSPFTNKDCNSALALTQRNRSQHNDFASENTGPLTPQWRCKVAFCAREISMLMNLLGQKYRASAEVTWLAPLARIRGPGS